jgi:hypothetical protein
MDRISELETKRKKRIEAEKEEMEVLSPILTDRALIKDIYSCFRAIANERSIREDSSDYLQKFLYIILTLYAPAVLLPKEMREKMPQGLRDSIAVSIGLFHHKSVISHNVAVVSLYYSNYKDFRSDVDYIYADILFWLEKSKGV